MVVTLETGEIVPKDEAARRVTIGLPDGCREVLDLARWGYLGEAPDDWTLAATAREAAGCLGDRVRGSERWPQRSLGDRRESYCS